MVVIWMVIGVEFLNSFLGIKGIFRRLLKCGDVGVKVICWEDCGFILLLMWDVCLCIYLGVMV